mgnify:CR=1 FL=1
MTLRGRTPGQEAVLLWHLVRQDFVERYAGSVLGMAWLLITPLMQILVFTLVFGRLIGPRIPGTDSIYAYGLYLVSGILPWMTFASTFGRTAAVFRDKAPILRKVPLRLSTVAVHVAVAETLALAAVLALFLAVRTAIFGAPPATAVYAPVVMVYQQLLALTLGLLAALPAVMLRDVKEAVGVVTFLWFWMTPIVYLVDTVPWPLQVIQPYNPAFWFSESWHRILVYGQAPDFGWLAASGLGVLALLGLVLVLLHRWEGQIRDFL